jgi:hypothetical protein
LAWKQPVITCPAQATRPANVRPDPDATAVGQMPSLDLTNLQDPGRGEYLHLYVMLDIFCRQVVGWTGAAAESAELSERSSPTSPPPGRGAADTPRTATVRATGMVP